MFLLGSFMNGLFGGMQSSFAMVKDISALTTAAAVTDAQNEKPTPSVPGAPGATPPGADATPGTQPPPADQTPASTSDPGKVTQTPLTPPVSQKTVSDSAASAPKGVAAPATLSTSERDADLARYAIWNPANPVGTEALTSATANPQGQPDPRSTVAAAPAPAPAQPATRSEAAQGTGPIIWTAALGLHHASPGESGFTWSADAGLKPFTWDGSPTPAPAQAQTQPPVPMQSTNAPVGATVGVGTGPSAITNAPVGATVGGGGAPSALSRPSALTNAPVGATVTGAPPGSTPAPTAAAPTPTPGPQSQAQPPTVGSRIGSLFSAVNPMGTAHAEGVLSVRPEVADASAAGDARVAQLTAQNKAAAQAGPKAGNPPPAPAAPAPAGITPPAAGAPVPASSAPLAPGAQVQYPPATTPAPAPAPTALAQPAPTPATPPRTETAAVAPAQAGAVPVAPTGGTGTASGKVAPGQTTPSVQSQSAAPTVAPTVSPAAWQEVNKKNPALAGMIQSSVDRLGRHGVVSVEDVAATMKRESNFNPDSPSDKYGSLGVMQVQPDTAAYLINIGALPKGTDIHTVQGNIDAGVAYMAHLAIDENLGSHTLQTNIAYMRGPGGAHEAALNMNEFLARNPLVARDIPKMYEPGTKLWDQSQFTAGKGTPYTTKGLVEAGQQGPSGILPYLASNGPAGLGMSDKWRIAQSALERDAILNGRSDMLPHIQEYVAQQSHMGALSNMAAADNALAMGNGDLAAKYASQAHAFMPDGAWARFGTDASGKQLWAQLYRDNANVALGKPFQITSDALRQQMVTLGNPTNYVQAIQKYQLENANIEQVKAHAQYYHDMPEVKQEVADTRQAAETQRAADRNAANQQLEAEREANREQLEGVKTQHKVELGEAQKGSSNAADERSVNSEINKDYADGTIQKGEMPETLGRQSQVDTILRRNDASGGAGMSGPFARETARDIINGKGAKLDRRTDANGNTKDAVLGPDGSVRGYLSTDMGDRIRGLAGSQKPGADKGAPGPGKQTMGGIGAGMNSPMVAMQGMNMNLSGMPMQPMQQQPSQIAAA